MQREATSAHFISDLSRLIGVTRQILEWGTLRVTNIFLPIAYFAVICCKYFAIVLININSDNITDIYIILDNLIVIIDITFSFNINNNIILVIIMVDINTLFFQSAVSACHG